MGNVSETEGLNLPKSTLTEFFQDMRGKLALLTGLVDAEEFGLTLEEIRRPMLVIGKPGIGKTCGIISIINELNEKLPVEKKLGFKKILLGQTVVGSLSGIPVAKPDGSVVRIQMPDLPNPERDGEYGVLFLDEITTADEMQIQPALGLADDSRCIGEYTLPPHWIVVGAGNGPDCSNFVRLDDMTISRFSAYDIAYDYQTDFRPYAHRVGIHEDIIAFLNFSPDTCVRVESTEADYAGKMFPCPRTWERLSIELKMRNAMRVPVDFDSMQNFAGRIIGIRAGREFGAFMLFKKNLTYDINAILAGTERKPEVGMAKETFHIILQGIIKSINTILSKESSNSFMPEFSADTYQKVGNAVTWLLDFDELEPRLNALFEIRNDIPLFSQIMFSKQFLSVCPKFDAFFRDNATFLAQNMSNLQDMKF